MPPWSTLERIPGLTTLPVVWKKLVGADFEPFRNLCLEPSPLPALSYPCAIGSSCAYRIRRNPDVTPVPLPPTSPDTRHPSPFVGTCQTDPTRCPLVQLSLADITPLQLNWLKLGRAICRALHLDSKATPLAVPTTLQIGSWSKDAVPVLLTIQTERHHLHFVICELIALLRQKFIVLTPTSKHYDAKTQQFLAGANSAIFPLDTTVTLCPDGTLAPSRPPADLFANFTPKTTGQKNLQPSTFNLQPTPRYMLRKGLGFWTLIFDGHEIVIKHERGIFYIAWLLTHPHECPIHALDLMAKIPEIYRQQLGLTEIADPATGKTTVLESHARLQERSLSLDDAQAMRALFRKEKELEAILDDPDESEPVKAEALRDLEAIAEFQKQHAQRNRSSAQRTAHSVQVAINRLHEHLAQSEDPVLAKFAEHINKHILVPSRRYAAPGHRHARSGLAGSFTYEPQSGLIWNQGRI